MTVQVASVQQIRTRKQYNMDLGNFAFYNGRFVILIAKQDTIIGTVWTIMDLDTEAISLVTEKTLKPYARKPKGVRPASDMTEKQQNAITRIQRHTRAKFNGRSLVDVSTFIGLFSSEARQNARLKAFEDAAMTDAMSPW